METLALILAVGFLGFIGFRFYQKRRSNDVHPLDASVEKAAPESFKFPDPPQQQTGPAEFPSNAASTAPTEPFRGFPRSSEPIADQLTTTPKKPRKPRQPKSQAVPSTPKKTKKTKTT